MLHGRNRELARIDELLQCAREGRSAALVLSGEPGIGKTALLEAAVERAGDLRVLRASGYESERDLPFAALHTLLAPILDLRDRIPPVQGRALGTALAIESPAPHDPFAVPAAVLSILGVAAEDTPLLAIVDDLQWLDPGSLRAILFAARRLAAEGVVFLLAGRPDDAVQPTLAGLSQLEVGRLDDDAARAMVRERAGGRISSAATEEVVRTAGGNPLALNELPVTIARDNHGGPGGGPALRLPPGSGVERSFRDRLDGLDEDARRALTLVAALETGPASLALAALGRLGLDLQDLESCEAAGLLRLEHGEVGFRHPLLRSLAYHGATSSVRLAAHRALAEVASDPSTRAWHLSSAALGPDENAAKALDEAAADARRRGAPGAAAAAAARAAELSGDGAARVERLAAAAEDLAEEGRFEDALARIDDAERLPEAAEHRSRLRTLRGRIEIRHGALAEGRRLLVEEAERCADAQPLESAQLLIEVGVGDMMSGDAVAHLQAAERARELALGKDVYLERFAALGQALALVPVGEAVAAEWLFEQAMPVLMEGDPLPHASELITFAALALVWTERFEEADRILQRQLEAARSASAIGRLVFPLNVRAQLHDRRGRWAAAVADAGEAEQLARDTGQQPQLALALATLASLEAARGQHEEAQKHAEETLRIVSGFGGGPLVVYAEVALGFAALAAERLDDAIEHLERAYESRLALQGREPAFLQFESDLIESYLRLGRREDAERAIVRLEGSALRTGRTWAHAVAERGRGMLAPDDEFAAHFEKALEWHAKSDQPFPAARTRLAYGERLRRAGERVAAREQLTAAAEAFERINATPWLERAQAELGTSGQTLRRSASPDSDALTPSELQVALRVAEGLTNREVAAAIFLSPKTVEHHLSSIYRKLGIRSRTELARRMASDISAVPA